MCSAIVLGRFAVLYFMNRLVHSLYTAVEGGTSQQLCDSSVDEANRM